MAKTHIVKQGDHLSRIAYQYGFYRYQTIWDHPSNAALKNKRKNPNVLFPGDQVVIPDKQQKGVMCETTQVHRFQIPAPKLKLRLVVEDIYEKPIANARCDLNVEGDVRRLTTDGTGKFEQKIPVGAASAVLTIKDAQTPFNETEIPIKIGYLDPVEETSGQTARLNNLGYYAGPLSGDNAEAPDTASSDQNAGSGTPNGGRSASDGQGNDSQSDSSPSSQDQGTGSGPASSADDDDSDEDPGAVFRSAVEEFQCDYGLTVDGICGPKTQAKLKQVHGC